MKAFRHFNTHSIDEAVSILERYGGRAAVIAGGTDLLGKMKDMVLPAYPEALVNIKTIPGLDYIKEEGGALKIGALTRLADIAAHPTVAKRCRALAQAAGRTASPNLRNMGTIGGNLCQDVRCWYYRTQLNRFSCLRKRGGRCYALKGDNRYHSIFGGSVEGGCVAVHPSDTAPALVALGASVKTTKRIIPVEDFFAVGPARTTVLDNDELVTEIQVPASPDGTRSAFIKFTPRSSIDFPVVNCAALLTCAGSTVKGARICLNAVYVVPYRAVKAEQALAGGSLDEAAAEEAGKAAVSGAKPLSHNAYMVQIAKALVKRSVLACRGSADA